MDIYCLPNKKCRNNFLKSPRIKSCYISFLPGLMSWLLMVMRWLIYLQRKRKIRANLCSKQKERRRGSANYDFIPIILIRKAKYFPNKSKAVLHLCLNGRKTIIFPLLLPGRELWTWEFGMSQTFSRKQKSRGGTAWLFNSQCKCLKRLGYDNTCPGNQDRQRLFWTKLCTRLLFLHLGFCEYSTIISWFSVLIFMIAEKNLMLDHTIMLDHMGDWTRTYPYICLMFRSHWHQ